MSKKIIVAGGGHGGIATAALLAKNGFDVTVYERHTRDQMGYDWTDIFDKKALFAIGLGMPEEGKYALKHDMTFISPSLENKLKQHTPEDELEIQMERRDIYDMLISYAEEYGVKFCWGVTVEGPVMLGNRVAGIRTSDGEKLGDLVIDACGASSPVRRNLPEYLGVQTEMGNFEKFCVYRAFFERTAEIPSDDFNVMLLHNGKLGISWVAIEENHTDVLIGRFAPLSEEEVKTELASLREEYPALGEKIVRGGQFVEIPVRQPLGIMVADGYAAIGDSAFMTVPLIGSGIANTLKASRILADTVIADEFGAFSVETLYSYQNNFFRQIGSGLAPIACVKALLTKITVDDVNYLFSSGMVNESDITMGADSTDLMSMLGGGIDLADLKIKALALIKDKGLLKNLLGTVGQIAAAISVCAAMPKTYSKKALNGWVKNYNKCFKM